MVLSLAMMALIEPGDEFSIPDPGFPIYPSFTEGSVQSDPISRCPKKTSFSRT